MKIICNTPGKGREVNPYGIKPCKHWNAKQPDTYCAVDDKECNCALFDNWNNNHAELPAFYSDRITPLPIGEWDVGLVWQAMYSWDQTKWYTVSNEWYEHMKGASENNTRQIYLSPLPPAQPVKAVEEEKFERWYAASDAGNSITIYNKSIDGEFDDEKVCEIISDLEYSTSEQWAYSRRIEKLPMLERFYNRFNDSPHPIETPAIATSEGVEEAAERYARSDKELKGEKEFLIALHYFKKGASHILTTHVPVDEVEKIKSVLKQIRRVELLTPETEALINKILNP